MNNSPENDSERKREYKLAFDIFDKDKDGKVTINDLKEIMKYFKMNPSKEELEMMKAEVDLDNNKIIDFEEYILFMNKRHFEEKIETEIERYFQIFDEKGEGLISVIRFKQIVDIMKKTMEKEGIDFNIDYIINMKEDDNNPGYINYKELLLNMH